MAFLVVIWHDLTGKRTFKQHLDLFTPVLLSTLSSPTASQLSQVAAVECMQALGRLIGPTIFLGRIPRADQSLYLNSCARFAGTTSKDSGSLELRCLPNMVVSM